MHRFVPAVALRKVSRGRLCRGLVIAAFAAFSPRIHAAPAGLVLKGNLYSSAGAPVTTATTMQFKIWDALTSGNLLYDSGAQSLTPDSKGHYSWTATATTTQSNTLAAAPYFELSAGTLASRLGLATGSVYLETSVGGTALSPRVASQGAVFALTADTVNGMVVSSTGSVGFGLTNPRWGEVVSASSYGNYSTNFLAITPGLAQGELSSFSLYSTFQTTSDNGPRRTADLVAGFNGSAWGTEYLALNVGGSDDWGDMTAEKMRIQYNGRVGIGTTSPGAGLDVATTGTGGSALIVPRDTVANRPTAPVNGMLRYASDTNNLEAYVNNSWQTVVSSTPGVTVTGGCSDFGTPWGTATGCALNTPVQCATGSTAHTFEYCNANTCAYNAGLSGGAYPNGVCTNPAGATGSSPSRLTGYYVCGCGYTPSTTTLNGMIYGGNMSGNGCWSSSTLTCVQIP